MSRPLRVDYAGAWHHVHNRGVRRSQLFFDEADRDAFRAILGRTAVQFDLRVHAFALVVNHFHLLVESAQGNLSQAMRWIAAEYARYFHHRYGTSGPLFDSRFVSHLVLSETYLMALVAYIHLNPVRAGLHRLGALGDRSSYRAYLFSAEKPPWLETGKILARFDSPAQFARWIEAEDRLDLLAPETDLGGAVRANRSSVPSHPGQPRPERLGAAVARAACVSAEELRGRRRAQPLLEARAALALLCDEVGWDREATCDYLFRSPQTVRRLLSEGRSSGPAKELVRLAREHLQRSETTSGLWPAVVADET